MRTLFYIVIAVAFLQGCIGPKKYARYINDVYNVGYGAKYLDTAIIIKSGMPVQFDSLVRVAKGKHYFIPVFVYYGLKETYQCELNPKVPIAIFSNEFHQYAHSKGIGRQLRGKRLELTLTSLPGQFTYSHKTDIIVPVFFVFSKIRQSIYPKLTYLTFSYAIYSGTEMEKSGTISLSSNEEPYSALTSRKKITKAYLGNYEQQLKVLTREAVDRLMSEL